jgi:hypothetical protein
MTKAECNVALSVSQMEKIFPIPIRDPRESGRASKQKLFEAGEIHTKFHKMRLFSLTLSFHLWKIAIFSRLRNSPRLKASLFRAA